MTNQDFAKSRAVSFIRPVNAVQRYADPTPAEREQAIRQHRQWVVQQQAEGKCVVRRRPAK